MPSGTKIQIKTYLQIIRAPGIFSIVSNTLASFVIVNSLIDGPTKTLDLLAYQYFPLLIISLLLFQAGMIMNDLADFEEDKKERPFRPLPSGRMSKKQAAGFIIAFTIAALLIAFSVSTSLFTITALLTLCILSYNLLSKSTIFGAANMAGVRLLNWSLALSLIPLNETSAINVTSLQLDITSALENLVFPFGLFTMLTMLVFLHTFAISLLSRYETGTLPKPVNISIVLVYLISLAICSYLILSNIFDLYSALPLISFLVFLIYLSIKRLNSISKDIQQWVTQLLKWMVLLDGMILIAFNEWLLGLICCSLLLFSGRLAKYVYMT